MSGHEQREPSGYAFDPHTDQSHWTVAPGRPAASRWRGAAERLTERLPVTLQGRWRLDRRTGTALAAVIALAAVAVCGWSLSRGQAHRLELPAAGPAADRAGAAGAPAAAPGPGDDPLAAQPPAEPRPAAGAAALPDGTEAAFAAPPSPTGAIIVDVEGKVARPGVVRLATGSRVLDALQAAGGALPGTDLAALNQARVLNDGEQVLVGAPAPAAIAAPAIGPRGGGRGKPALTGPVHLNTATVEELEQLPGVGPALAQRILDWRTAHGRFSSPDQLQQVKGLGAGRLAALQGLVTL